MPFGTQDYKFVKIIVLKDPKNYAIFFFTNPSDGVRKLQCQPEEGASVQWLMGSPFTSLVAMMDQVF